MKLDFDKLTSMSFTKFAALVGMIYFECLFIGTAYTQQNVLFVFIAIIWLAIILVIFPIFRKGGNE